MANEYYYSQTIGFNTWYVVGPVIILCMMVLGSTTYALNQKTLRVQKRRGEVFLLKAAAALLDVPFTLLIMSESGAGLLQFIINTIDEKTDVLWAVALLTIVIAAMAVLNYLLFFIAGRVGEWAKHGYVLDLQRVLVRERNKERKIPRREWSSLYDPIDGPSDDATEITEESMLKELQDKMAIVAWPKPINSNPIN